MAALEFKFSSDQQHQLEAIEATCDLFRGQQFIGSVFSADSGRKGQTAIGELMVGHGNELRVAPGQLLDNLHAVQEEGCLPATDVLTDGRLRDFTVEMETGTGKTYVYIRSIYELNRRYGITKFVIVVPSVAIREGVLKSLQTTRRHFETLYDRTPLDYFVYDSKDMGPVGNFATSSSIQVMVINIDAFNKGLEKDGTAKEGNLFHRPSEKLTGGFSPRELVSACKPVVIIDEPQSVDNTKQAKAAIKSLNPLFVLRYSATHKQAYNMIYRLTPVDAFERHLVKGICVDSIKAEANLNGAYVRLESVKSDPFSAKVSIDVRQADGTQKRKAVTVKTGNDLYQKSGENSDYESGWVVNNIGAAVGDEFIEFQNGEVLELGEALGDVNEEVVKRAQIRRTIEDHLARQFELWPRGVKVLSLFFIDRVDRYRVYEPEVHGGLYALMFEEEYAGALNSKAPRRIAKAAGIGKGTWLECYEAVGAPLVRDPHAVHQGYFAKDKKGKFKDSKGAAGTADDAGAFELIMQKKETLISFPDGKDADKDVSFVFSHSALKEGWDNPNVFQICTLKHSDSETGKRQEVGRGLRLCVNREGERQDLEALGEQEVQRVNTLTVIASESYSDFTKSLQKDINDALRERPKAVTEEFLKGFVVQADEEKTYALTQEDAHDVYFALVQHGLIDREGVPTQKFKESGLTSVTDDDLPEHLYAYRKDIEALVKSVYDEHALDDYVRNGNEPKVRENPLNANFARAEFQELWNKINSKHSYTVDFDDEELRAKAIDRINRELFVAKASYVMTTAAQRSTQTRENLERGESFGDTTRRDYEVGEDASGVTYDLLGEVATAARITRRSAAAILKGIAPVKFRMFRDNPEEFIAKVSRCVLAEKATMVVDHITYHKLDERYDSTIFAERMPENVGRALETSRCIQDYVFWDSEGERDFARDLDSAEGKVAVYAKLPRSFKIPTPVGSYAPDWAIAFEKGSVRHVFFVAETKGSMDSLTLRDIERGKIACARKLFNEFSDEDVRYDVVHSYEDLLTVIQGTE